VFSLQRSLGAKKIFYNRDMDLSSFHIFNNFKNQPSFVLVLPLSESISIFHSDEISKSLLLLMKGDLQFDCTSESFGILEKYMFNFMVPVIINQASLIHWFNEGFRDALMLMVPIDVYYAADMITTFISRNYCSGPLRVLYVNELDEQYVVNILIDIFKCIEEKVADVVNAKDKKYISQLIQNFDSSLERKREVNIDDVENITDSIIHKATVDKMLKGQLKLRKKNMEGKGTPSRRRKTDIIVDNTYDESRPDVLREVETSDLTESKMDLNCQMTIDSMSDVVGENEIIDKN
jgi:hypothetical protein